MAAPVIDDLVNDGRLARLFSQDGRPCALQIWILQIKSKQAVEHRVLYGRLIPYSFSNNKWSGSEDDNFSNIEEHQAQIFKLNLYVPSTLSVKLVRQLTQGKTIGEISELLGLNLSDDLKGRFGTTTFFPGELFYRPASYLLNRDALELTTISSPHGAAGAFSAAVVRADKDELFRIGQYYNTSLAKYAVDHLNAETGLDFGNRDAVRFGDLELMVFPTLDDREGSLLKQRWDADPPALIFHFDPKQLPYYSGFYFRVCISNDGLVAYSSTAAAKRDSKGAFVCRFEIDEHLRARTDSIELEVYGLNASDSDEGVLCIRWRVFCIREINLYGTLVGNRNSPVSFQWLEKTIRPSSAPRAKGVLTPDRDDRGFQSCVGGRDADPWVPAYRALHSLFERLHPPKSEGRFFLRWGQGNPDARLEFTEWFRALLSKYSQNEIVIFDPYFDDVGLSLLLICAAAKAEYIIFRSLPKRSKKSPDAFTDTDDPAQTGINNLLDSCEINRERLSRVKLRIYGMRHGRLHDRYILIIGQDSLPTAGFNMSNSLHKAAENYPLLVTPIPQDVLLEVNFYKMTLVREAQETVIGKGDDNTPMRLLFESSVTTRPPRRFESLSFLDRSNAGDVLSGWTGERSLRGLSGEGLKAQMSSLGLIQDQSLSLHETPGLFYFVERQAKDFTDFTPTWEVLGELLARCRAGDTCFEGGEFCPEFIAFLARFLKAAFKRPYCAEAGEVAVLKSPFFSGDLDTFLKGSHRLEDLSQYTKYTLVSWAEYFAINILWLHSPEALVALAKTEMIRVPEKPEDKDIMRLSLLSQIASIVSLSVQFRINENQRNALICSKNGMLQWLGLIAVRQTLGTSCGLSSSLEEFGTFSYSNKIKAVGWMINGVARNANMGHIYQDLIAKIHKELPSNINKEDLDLLVDSMRGHMRQLRWAEPWLFEQRGDSVSAVQNIVKRQQRILQQPLASTSDWSRWNSALTICMQALTFARWTTYYLSTRSIEDSSVDVLTTTATDLALMRPMDEWRAMGDNDRSELASFLEKAEQLLNSSITPRKD